MKKNRSRSFPFWRNIACLFFTFLIVGTASAQNFIDSMACGNYNDTTGWIYSNSISYVGPGDTSFVITNPIGNQAGYVYYNTPVNLTACAQFDVSFDFQIIPPGPGSPPPYNSVADGIAFWYIANPPSGFLSGGGIGLPNDAKGLITILDTYDNDGNFNNPLETLVGYDGTVPAYVEGSTVGVLSPTVTNQNFIDDGTWHHCEINYNSGAVNVYFDNSTTPSLSGTYPMNQVGYFGFSAATGAVMSTQSIRHIHITGFIPPPPPGVAADTINYCQGDVAPQLTATGTNINWYTTPTGGTPLAAAPTPNTTVPSTTTWYVAQAYTPGGCESNRDSITVNVGATVSAAYNNIDTIVCASKLFEFRGAYSGNTSQWYQWQISSDDGASWTNAPLSRDSVFDQVVFLTGDYWVRYYTYLDTPGNHSLCIANSVTSKVRRNPDIHVSNTVTDAVCFNAKNGTINIPASSGRTPLTYVLSPDGTSNQTGSFSGLDTGRYTVYISDADGKCKDTVENMVIQQPTQLMIRDSIIKVSPTCLKDADGSLTVGAYGGIYPYLYVLNPVNQYSVDGNFTGLTADTYTLDVKDANNCTVSTQIELTAEACCKVFIPTAFTPNNDGKNDHFKASSNAAIRSLDLHVYNRYGEEVFHSTSTEDKGWDGTYNGVPAEVGTYFFVGSYFCEDVNKEYTLKGNLTLIR